MGRGRHALGWRIALIAIAFAVLVVALVAGRLIGWVLRLQVRPATELWSSPLTTKPVGYGGACAAIEDQDGDGVKDVAVSACSEFGSEGGFVDILSSRDGRSIARIRPSLSARGFGKALVPVARADPFLVIASNTALHAVTRRADGEYECAELFAYPQYVGWRNGAAAIDDVDGDGRIDYVIGMLQTGIPRPKGSAMLLQSTSSDGWRIDGDLENDRLGLGVVAIHDADDDGLCDALVWGQQMCAILSSRTGQRIATLRGEGLYARNVAWCDDLTGDSVPDICIGEEDAESLDGAVRAGAIHVIDGATFEENRVIRGTREWQRYGLMVLDLGDVNGDGTTDLCVASQQYNIWHLDVLSGETDALLGSAAVAGGEDYLWSAAVIGDVDADGIRDVVLGLSRGMGPKDMQGYVTVISAASLLAPGSRGRPLTR